MSEPIVSGDVDGAGFEDFDEMAGAFRTAGWDAGYRQMSAGVFRGSLLSASLGSVQITHGHWGKAIRHTGVQPAATHALAFPLSSERRGERWLGSPFGPTNVLVQGGRSEFDLTTWPDCELGIFTINETFLCDRIAALTQRDPEQFVKRQGLLTLQPETAIHIRRALELCFENLRASSDSPDGAAAVRPMGEDLTDFVLQVVADAHFDPLPMPALGQRVRLVREAEEFARANESSVVRISDLCRHLGVCERTLRYAFAELTGMSPAAYLRTQRFNRVRQVLAEASPGRMQVKTVAYEHGFWHLGQFARDYHKLFGERPSTTLRTPQGGRDSAGRPLPPCP